MLQDPVNVSGLGAGFHAIFANDSGPADRVGVFMVRTAVAAAPPTIVPTPALLPGLIGFGLSVFRRKQRQVTTA
ncbi:MAG: PTPA-CTERM sorting domain-containing protein [Synechococcales cyanobacterium RU_4_20]|nr:PTPA-CTERM sorting domain-containing protein [Synechococcales cyanobacterium RU_4_20]